MAEEVFRNLRETSRDVYKGVIISLAKERRLRPVFIQRKPVEAQVDWLVKTAKLKSSDGVVEHVLQVWLLKSHKELLIDFLDAIGLPHDGDGTVDELPDELDADKVGPAIDVLLKNRSPELVATYLWVFQLQKPGGWPPLTERLQQDPRLAFGSTDASVDSAPVAVVETAPDPEPDSGAEPEEA